MKSVRTLLPAVLIGLAAFWGVLELTEPPGPGLDPDSMAYLGAGASLAHGHGLRVPSASWSSTDSTAPLVHFPPGFPATIALGVLAGATPENAARFVEGTAAGVTAAALVLAATAAAGPLAALAVLAIAAATPAFVIVHSSVLSEPLFLALLALFTLQLARERHDAGRGRTIRLGALAAAATLVRYAGISLVAVLVLDAWWSLDGPWRHTWKARAKRAFVAAELPVLALGIWMLTRPHSEDAEKIREVGVYTAGFGATLAGGFATAARWLAPGVESDSARALAATAIFAGLLALAVRTVRAARRGGVPQQEARLYRAAALVLFVYGGVLVASRLLADPGIPFDERILAPAFLLVILAAGVAAAGFWRASFASRRGAALLTMGITLSWLWGSAGVSAGWVDDLRSDGGDLAGYEWASSSLVSWARAAPAGTTLYSNWPAVVWFHTSRAAHELPDDLDSATVGEFREKIAREHGALLAFTTRAEDYVPPDSLAALAGLVAVARGPDGTIWRAPADSARLHP